MKINDRNIELSNTDKILFQEDQITKGDMIEYYKKIASVMIPHMKDRPLTLHRFPNGIDEEGFYQQEISDYFPKWINRASVKKKEGGKATHVICNNTETLVYLANQACITPHIWLSKTDALNKPNKMIFDLDPPEKDYSLVVKAAKELKNFFDSTGLKPFVMTTGSKGLHVVVPITTELNFDEVREYAAKIADTVAKGSPKEFTTEQRKNKRKGRVFMDYLRNAYGQTSVAPYGIRSIEGAPVAAPLDWKELSEENFDPQKYNIHNIFQRLGQKEDPWKDIMSKAVSLNKVKGSL